MIFQTHSKKSFWTIFSPYKKTYPYYVTPYKALLSSPAAQPILNSLTLVPVLVAVLGNLQKMTVEEREERAGALWYSSLSKSLLNKFGCDISDESFNSVDCLKLAQQLVDSPIPDTFKFLTSNLDSCEGEE